MFSTVMVSFAGTIIHQKLPPTNPRRNYCFCKDRKKLIQPIKFRWANNTLIYIGPNAIFSRALLSQILWLLASCFKYHCIEYNLLQAIKTRHVWVLLIWAPRISQVNMSSKEGPVSVQSVLIVNEQCESHCSFTIKTDCKRFRNVVVTCWTTYPGSLVRSSLCNL